MKIFFGAMIMLFLSSSIFAAIPPDVHVVIKNRTDAQVECPDNNLFITGIVTAKNGGIYRFVRKGINPGNKATINSTVKRPFHTITKVEVNFYRLGRCVAQCSTDTPIDLSEGGTVSIVATGYWNSQKKPTRKVTSTVYYKGKAIACDCNFK